MNKKEVSDFIANNTYENLHEYFNKALEKLKDLNKKLERLLLYMTISLFIYFFSSKTVIPTIQFGPLAITDLSIIMKIIPLLFSMLLVDLSISYNHKQEVQKITDAIFFSLYNNNLEESEYKSTEINSFSRILSPFSYLSELFKLQAKNPNNFNIAIMIILLLPYLVIAISPFCFEIYMIRNLYFLYSTGIIAKGSFILSIWISLLYLYVIINEAINFKKENNLNLDFFN